MSETKILSLTVVNEETTRHSSSCEDQPIFMDLSVERTSEGGLRYVIRSCRLDGHQFPALVLQSRSRARVRWEEASGGEILADNIFEGSPDREVSG